MGGTMDNDTMLSDDRYPFTMSKKNKHKNKDGYGSHALEVAEKEGFDDDSDKFDEASDNQTSDEALCD